MAGRTCKQCGKADNPIGRLRFKKSRVDGKIYCENCTPVAHSIDNVGRVPEELTTLESYSPASSVPSIPRHKASAGYVVVACPDCSGGVHRPKNKPCKGCAGYGAVRLEASMLNVYRPTAVPAPSILTEG